MKAAKFSIVLIIFLISVFGSFDSGAQAAPLTGGYRIIEIGTLGGTESSVQGISNNGDIVGYSQTTGDQATHAFVYRNGQMTDLGTLGGTYSYAWGINDNGDIYGESSLPGNHITHPFLYRNGQMIDLGSLGGSFTRPYGINNNGDVVGYSYTANGQQHAFIYRNGQMTDLTPNNFQGAAYAVNDSGDVVFQTSFNFSQPYQAFLYRGGQTITLGTLGGASSYAYAISNNGDIVGGADTLQGRNAFLYRNGQMINLGTLGGVLSEAYAINANGDILGYSLTTGNQAQHAFLYHNGQMTDLGTLGGAHSVANGMNDNGEVVGYSYTVGNGARHAFVYRDGQMFDLGALNGDRSQALGINNNGVIIAASYVNNVAKSFVVKYNTAPAAVADSFATNEDAAISGNVLSNDTDAENDALAATLVSAPANAANFTLNANGSFTYQPAANFNGSDSFTYKAGDGQFESDIATVSITIAPVNDAPTIQSGSTLTRAQNALAATAQIASVTDVDNAAGSLAVTVQSAPAGIIVSNITNNNGLVSASVQANCSASLGANIVTLKVSDGVLSSTANLIVAVTPSNPAVIVLKPFITLSPPNHKMQTFTVSQMVQSATDDCSGNVTGNVFIEKATSDEAVDIQGSGSTAQDIVIGADYRSIDLRSERSGTGNGRVYTVTLKVVNSSGSTTRAIYKVFVPKGSQTAIEDAPAFTVYGAHP